MSIADFFFGRKQNSTNSRRSVKLNRNAVRTRTLSMEPLETRDLLSVTTGLIDADDVANVAGAISSSASSENLTVELPIANQTALKSSYATPDGYNDNDYQKMVAFLEQTDSNGVKNGTKLNQNYSPTAPSTWSGISWKTFNGERNIYTISIADQLQTGTADFSNMTQLQTLYCNGNQLMELNLSGCVNLTYFGFPNALEHLNVSGCTGMTGINFHGSSSSSSIALKTLNATGCINLTSLQCYFGQLTSLDVSGCTALIRLDCHSNQLTELDISGCTALTSLDCSSNKLTELDVSNIEDLTNLYCNDNQIKFLNATGCLNLSLSDNTTNYDRSNNSSFRIYNNPIETLNISNCTGIIYFNYFGTSSLSTTLKTLNVSGCTALLSLDCSYGQLTTLNVSNCTALTSLSCYSNLLTSLDVSKNTALTLLSCGSNQLTSLNVSKNTSLTSLSCGSNQLTYLNVSKNTAITSLYCDYNMLTDLDVSKNTLLTKIVCDSNQLTSLNVSTNILLTELYCRFNQLTSLDVSNHVELYALYCNDNHLVSIDLSGCTKFTLNSSSNLYTKIGTGSGRGSVLNTIAIFNNPIEYLDISGCSGITSLSFVGSSSVPTQLKSLNVSGCTKLKTLNCICGQLSSLNLSGCTNLTSLNCSSNELISLNISQNRALTELDCSFNQLMLLDISLNENLTKLDCSSNPLESLNVSQNGLLQELDCSSNQLTSLDVSNNENLTTLNCSLNQLMSLSLSQNVALTSLICESNRLTFLDLTNNTMLTTLSIGDSYISSVRLLNEKIENLTLYLRDSSYIVTNSYGSYTINESSPYYPTVLPFTAENSTTGKTITFYSFFPLTEISLSTDTPEVGTVINSTLGSSEITATYQWYSGMSPIAGATASSFTVTTDQIGQTITCIATGTGDYTGSVSATTAVVPALHLDTPSDFSLVADNLTVTASWSTVKNASVYTLEYQIDGFDGWTNITGINGTTTSFIGIAGATYNVRVKANGSTIYDDSDYSEIKSVSLGVPITNLTLSTDSPEVGTVITATLLPSNATASYQWYSGTDLISGATGSSFEVTTDQIGKTISCVATGTGVYSGTVSATTSVVKAMALTTPEITNLTNNGMIVTAAWSEINNASSYTIEYQLEGSESWMSTSGLQNTSASFIGELGKTYNVRVKAIGTGDYSDSDYSETKTMKLLYTLDTPQISSVTTTGRDVVVAWSAVGNASGYAVEYKLGDSDWSVLATTDETTASLTGQSGIENSFRVKAIGTGIYMDSAYSQVQTITIADTLDAQNDFVKTTLNSPVVIDYRDNDEATDWSVVTVQFGEASHGEYVVNEDGTISYTPENGFFGTDTIGYVLFSPSGKASVGSISISVGLPIATSVQKTSSSHSPSSAMAPSVDSMTDWDNCCIELWAQGVNELNSGETTVTLEYNPAVYDVPYFSACADGVALAASEGVVLPNGNVEIQLTVQVLEPISSQTDNLFLGTVVLTPSEDGYGAEDGVDAPACVLDGLELTTTVETMPYDMNHNGAIDVSDFVAFATVFGTNLGTMSPDNPLYAQALKADFNKDGIVNIDDFIAFSINFGATKKRVEIPASQASAAADSGNREWEAGNGEVIDSQVETPDAQSASPTSQLVTRNSQLVTRNSQLEVESSMTLLEAYSAALLDLYDNQENFDQTDPGVVLAESRTESPVASHSDDASQNTPFDAVDAVLEEDLLTIDWE